jgi:hypothetical protein
VRRDLADYFSTRPEGAGGAKAVAWRLVDEAIPRTAWAETVTARAAGFAARSSRPAGAAGIELTPLDKTRTDDAVRYSHVSARLDRVEGAAHITIAGPTTDPPTDRAGIFGQGEVRRPAPPLNDSLASRDDCPRRPGPLVANFNRRRTRCGAARSCANAWSSRQSLVHPNSALRLRPHVSSGARGPVSAVRVGHSYSPARGSGFSRALRSVPASCIDSPEASAPKFLVTYVGGGMPHDPELMAQARAAFGAWLAQSDEAATDPGAPVHAVARLAAGKPAAEVEVNGFSIIEAADLAAVKQILSSHPFIGRGGILQVSEFIGV